MSSELILYFVDPLLLLLCYVFSFLCFRRRGSNYPAPKEMASREDSAAAKIQALQRGKTARLEVEKKKKEETEAARRIQALQRGRRDRQAVEQRRKELQLFIEPHTFSCPDYTVVQLQPNALRKKQRPWTEFVVNLEAEAGRPIDIDSLYYSTSTLPTSFANRLTQTSFETLMQHDKAAAEAKRLREEHEAIEAAKPPPPPPPPVQYDEDGNEIPPPPKPRRQLREEAEQRKQDRERLQKVLEAEHKVACLAQKLPNMFLLHSIRIGFQVDWN